MRVLIASSATGGHIYPALAVAEEIKRRDPEAEIMFVGAGWEIGRDIVQQAGYRQEFIEVSGIDRKNPLKAAAALAGLARASREIRGLLKRFRPDVCFGTGGHVAGPVIREARKAGVRTMIQEQNVIPGMANKLAEKYADLVFAGFPDTAGHFKDRGKVIISGNPVRAAFSEASARRGELREKYGVPEGACCVLVFGGSQGADAINDAALVAAQRLPSLGGFHIVWITGRQLFEGMMERLTAVFPEMPEGLTVMGYSDEIFELYAAADLIVSRAGALTISEIAHSGRASILVPSPNVTNNHQYYNARPPADAGAAVLMPEEEISGGGLAKEIERLAGDPGALSEMGRKALAMARPDAVKVIVDEIFGS